MPTAAKLIMVLIALASQSDDRAITAGIAPITIKALAGT